jgi:DNA-damage-inducible protein D
MNNIKLFEEKKVRTHWDSVKEIWYFSVIDVIEILTESSIPKRYWSDLKKKLSAEGSEVYEKIVRLELKVKDKKMIETDKKKSRNIIISEQVLTRIIYNLVAHF